jgi:predicted metalloendopeptidase
MIATGKVEYGKNKMLTEKSRKQIKALIKQALGGTKAAKAKKPAPKAKKAAAKDKAKLDAAIKDPEKHRLDPIEAWNSYCGVAG